MACDVTAGTLEQFLAQTTRSTSRTAMSVRAAIVTVAIALFVGACATSNGSSPGAVTSQSEVQPNAEPSLPNADTQPLEQGITYVLRLNLHCGMKYIYNVDGRNWETSNSPYNGTGRMPTVLRDALVDPNESVSPVLVAQVELLSDDELLLKVPEGDLSVTYRPSSVGIEPCA